MVRTTFLMSQCFPFNFGKHFGFGMTYHFKNMTNDWFDSANWTSCSDEMIIFYFYVHTASPSRQNFVCLVRSRLRCHVRRHRHARNKGKFGSYAFLHTTPSDYIRSHCTSYFTFIVLNKMNLSLLKLFSFTFMWES